MSDPDSVAPHQGGRRLTPLRLVGALIVVVGLALVVVALFNNTDGTDGPASSDPTSVTAATDVAAGPTTPTTPEGLGVGWGTGSGGRRRLRGFSEVSATITSSDGTTCRVCLLAATTADQRQRGLMQVTDRDLGGYDGMLFRFAEDQNDAFWMYDTPMPLSIAYFGSSGQLVSTADMAPCRAFTTCPGYPSDGPFASALEVPSGRLDELGVDAGSSIRVDSLECPLAGK